MTQGLEGVETEVESGRIPKTAQYKEEEYRTSRREGREKV